MAAIVLCRFESYRAVMACGGIGTRDNPTEKFKVESSKQKGYTVKVLYDQRLIMQSVKLFQTRSKSFIGVGDLSCSFVFGCIVQFFLT